MLSVTGDEGFELIESKITSCKFACKLEISAGVTFVCHVWGESFSNCRIEVNLITFPSKFDTTLKAWSLIGLFNRRVLWTH